MDLGISFDLAPGSLGAMLLPPAVAALVIALSARYLKPVHMAWIALASLVASLALGLLGADLEAERMLPWIVGAPLAGAVFNGLFGRFADKRLVTGVGVGTLGVSTSLAAFCLARLAIDTAPSIAWEGWTWFSVTSNGMDVPVQVRFVADHLSGLMALMVSGIALLIHIYSTEYMGDDPGYARFMAYLNLFCASMLILVLASNLPLMFVGWEGVGLCSYLLIGFWWTNPAYAAAGRKAFVMNRIGDFGVLLGTFVLLHYCNTFEFAEINARIENHAREMIQIGVGPIGITVATAAALFLFVGCAGKSAQIPLYTWLPDAMAGPTPVSALIHAATMVTAGVYLCCRLSPVFAESETAMATIAVVGALTALLGASIGVVQYQMKRILAYSTVSQLGFMFAAVGVGAFSAGFFHVFTHAFFKACLFLGAGSVMHAVHAHGDADIRKLGGMRHFMPVTHATFLVACLAIAGIPPFAGFFSKDEILLGALEGTAHLPFVGWFVFAVLGVSAFLTAFYMFRMYFLVFWGNHRGEAHAKGEHAEGEEHAEAHTPHESGDAITIPLLVLAVGALAAGFLGLPHFVAEALGVHPIWSSWLTHAEHGQRAAIATWELAGVELPTWFPYLAMGVGLVVALGGVGLAWVSYREKDETDTAREALVVRIAVGLGAVAAIGLVGYPLGRHLVDVVGRPMAHTMPTVALGLALAFLAALVLFALAVAANPRTDVHGWALAKWRVDELYDAVIVRPFSSIAVVVSNVDRIAVDGLLTWIPPQLVRVGAMILSRLQSGAVYAYTTGLALGAAALVWWFTYPHSTLETSTEGATVTFTADTGPGYAYRWDFDSDGTWDSCPPAAEGEEAAGDCWSDEPSTTHTYGGGNDSFVGLVAIVAPMTMPPSEPIEIELGESPQALLADLGPEAWARSSPDGQAPASPQPATIRIQGGAVHLEAHDAAVNVGGTAATAEQGGFDLAPGDTARIGVAMVRIAVRARATLQVRSAFGNLVRVSETLTVEVPHTALERVSLAPHAAPEEVAR